MKDRVTILTCANVTRTDRLTLLIIGHAAKPRCFQDVQKFPLLYKGQKKALMNTAFVWDWYKNLYAPHVTQRKPNGRYVKIVV